MISHNLSLGDQGEDLACTYLEKKGYTIREKKWRSKIGEIDIIAEKNGVFVFVEVKTRGSTFFGYPEEAVTETKRRHLIRTTELYCQYKNINAPYRIDVIAIISSRAGSPEIVHIEDITGA